MGECFQISFMPWVSLGKPVTLGPVTFWPYRIKSESRINDPIKN
ncbi:hypothetical protein D1BOALGB6SA_2498 [Olavius sp. associated proteobacterium Delta 1]|nr:hypothetical protein D1BOALGB6SA_2498 [Olavius sp. associated proteobacterium Delta 1]